MNIVTVMPQHDFVFPARLVRVIDGDTIDVTIDAGFHSYRIERLRLLGVNAPERKTTTMEAGNKAKQFVMLWMVNTSGKWPLIVQTHKTDVFGRYLAMVWNSTTGACLNDDLLSSGNAVPFMTS